MPFPFNLFDIGISLLGMVLETVTETEDGQPATKMQPILDPVPARLVVQRDPYGNLPNVEQQFTIEERNFRVEVTPEEFPEIFAFVQNGGRWRQPGNMVSDGETLESQCVLKGFDAIDQRDNAKLTGQVSVTVAPTEN